MSGSSTPFKTAAQLAEEKGLAVPPAGSTPASVSTHLAPDRLDVVRRLFANSKDQLNDAEIAYVLSEADRTKLDPIRQMAAWRDRSTGKIITHTRIDGLLALAERTGKYRGLTPTLMTWVVEGKTIVSPIREGPPASKEEANLVAATCGVRREGYPEPVEATRYWADCAPKDIAPGSSWDRQPAIMLEKCALAASLRRAFPQDLAGLYEPAEVPRREEEGESGSD